MKNVIPSAIMAAVALTALAAQASAPSSPQGMITLRTYQGDARSAIRDGTAIPDGQYYPKRMEAPFNGINAWPGDDPGVDDVLPPPDWRNSYTAELVGYFYPPKTGKIQFAIAADDVGELWLSPDENPANKVQIAVEPDWHPRRAFASEDRRGTTTTGEPQPRLVNQSAYIQVTAGKPCFIQALAMETGGSDNLAVAFRYEDDPPFSDGDIPIRGEYLSTFDRPDLKSAFVSRFAPSATGFVIDIHNGDGPDAGALDQSTLSVQLDGSAVTVTVSVVPPVATVTYTKADGFLTPQIEHVVTISFRDTIGNDLLVEKRFTVYAAPKWQITWTDHPANPVDLKSPGARAYMPCVLYNPSWPAESRYRIWYDTASIAGIAYSSSADGVNWTQGIPLTGINTAADSIDGKEFAGRPFVLYRPEWAKPYRIYYYGKTETSVYKVFVAESADGISFENNQVALDPTIEGSRLGTYPDGHAVAYLPGRNPTPEDPFTERPFIMYFRDKSGQGIAYAESADGYAFFEVPDDLNTVEIEGLIRISGVPEGATFSAQPTHVLQLAQNDLRMWAFRDNTGIQYLVSPNGIDWQLIEDPVLNVGSLGPDGSWNDERNYYASAAYVGQGKFILARSGRSKTGEQLYRTGISFGQSAFYQENDIGKWAHLSPMNDWQSEGWAPYTSSANNPDGVTTALINNGDGTVSVRDRKESGNFYMVHDAALTVPFTFEFRARLDYATGTGADTDHPKYMVGAFINDPLHPGGEAWQPAFAASRFGGWALATDPSAETDNTQFQTFTVVCKFDEGARAQLAINSGNSTANVNLCVYEVFLNRDFSAPKVVYHNTGFFGWGDVDLDGRIDIGFPGPSAGQVTVDWIRWGNGVIHDPQDPPSAPPVLAITKVANGVRLDWTGGGVLQSAQSLGGAWQDETGVSSGAVLPITNTQKFYRVRQ